jgi:hypothetical protein
MHKNTIISDMYFEVKNICCLGLWDITKSLYKNPLWQGPLHQRENPGFWKHYVFSILFMSRNILCTLDSHIWRFTVCKQTEVAITHKTESSMIFTWVSWACALILYKDHYSFNSKLMVKVMWQYSCTNKG